MFKLAAFLTLVAIVVASPADLCMKEKANILTMAMKNVELVTKLRQANLSKQQIEAIFESKGDCDDFTGAFCMEELTPLIISCIAEADTGASIQTCVEEALGVDNDCYPCICWVIQFLGFTC